MRFSDLVRGLRVEAMEGDPGVEVTGVAYDSRRVTPGDAFFCVRGYIHDGHDFIPDAVAQGAVALVVEGREGLAEARAWLSPGRAAAIAAVPGMRPAMGLAAANFFDHPSRRLRVIGVTGTNGKTTTTHLVRELLVANGCTCGLIGTVHNVVGGESLPAGRTTPEAFDLQDLALRMVRAGDRFLSMEVGSHALALDRVTGFDFNIAVFTNLSQDHLDFHKDLESYFLAKARLFENLGRNGRGASGATRGIGGDDTKAAILNAEDPASGRLASIATAPVVTYGTDSSSADVRAARIRLEPSRAVFFLVVSEALGGSFPWVPAYEGEVVLSMTGRHNVANALAALTSVLVEGVSPEGAVAALAGVKGAAGRFETVDAGQDFMAVVDYAHTPDGLENVLGAARALKPRRVITVFGCGGDRDKTKRPLMGEVVARLSDLCVVTSDNPRSERPEAIIDDIRPGLAKAGRRENSDYFIEPDRAKAIDLAVRAAGPGDLVLVAGKGHETYQMFADRTIHFDDREVLRDCIARTLRAREGGPGGV
ncbi:MAG: UDP-N-acetylmuramoyl-L-alanyl-D-glutamate--2,6-diaminopimelate ligase [Bacillota bacterium]|nr:MAG: UDP-N-acetylmuramoyl-L-alanyl-D-glutamate--2,6-diaminopimelate ligase [Bacillota bacterium]